ncbi:CDGP domain-containing protein [Mycolicibacterium psychrotolerans]
MPLAFCGLSAVATPALAAPIQPGCVQQLWMMFGLKATTRTICDSEVRPDGSWFRQRQFYAPAYLAPGHSYCSSYECTYYPPEWVPEFNKYESYMLTPNTVLPDEPGHIA